MRENSQNPWNNRTATVAILFAFISGVIGALAFRDSNVSVNTVVDSEDLRSPIHWRVPVAFSTNLPALGDNIVDMSASLKAASAGRIDLRIFEPGLIVPTFSITESVKDSKVEAGYTWLGYDAGKISATPLVSAVPFGMEPWEFTTWYYEHGGKRLTEELYLPHQIHPILCGIISPETAGWFRQPIETLEDFKGLKIRFAGLGGRVLQRLGASVTLIPGSEIYQALEKGAIDATEFSLPLVDQKLGFNRVAKYNYFPGWHQTFTSFHLVVNRTVWDALPNSDQALIEMACTAAVTRNLAKAESQQGAVMSGFGDLGVQPKKLPREVLQQLQTVSHQVLNDEASKDEDFARIWESQKRFMEVYKIWKDHAYLPRDFDQ